MGTPFMSEVKIVSFNFPPKGWAFCNGQLLPINQNQALFTLLGTRYGGNGQTNFALPDLRGKTAIHVGQGFVQGQSGGQEAHTLSMSEMPAHNHFVNASSTPGDTNDPSNHLLAANAGPVYKKLGTQVAMTSENITFTGGGQAHENRQPFLVLNYVIALQGVFPSQN